MFIKLRCITKDKTEVVSYINMGQIEHMFWDDDDKCSILKTNSTGLMGVPGGYSVREKPMK